MWVTLADQHRKHPTCQCVIFHVTISHSLNLGKMYRLYVGVYGIRVREQFIMRDITYCVAIPWKFVGLSKQRMA